MQAEINRELKQKLTINEHGRQKKITKQQAIAKRLVNDAINGKNNRFIWSYLFQREEELHGTITPEGKTAREQLDDFIQKAKARQLARKQAEND
jgi:hypothetical protein